MTGDTYHGNSLVSHGETLAAAANECEQESRVEETPRSIFVPTTNGEGRDRKSNQWGRTREQKYVMRSER